MEAVGQRGDGIVHAERMGVFDRGSDLGEQAVHRGRELGHGVANDSRSWAGEVALLDGQQPVAKRGQGAGAFTIRPFGSDVADKKAECAGHDRSNHLLIEAGDVEEGHQGKEERGDASRARKQGVANLLSRSVL